VRPEASADAFRIRLKQGVADTAAEAVLADALAAKGVSAGAGANAGALLSKSDGSKPWIAIAPKDVAAVEKLGLPTDVAARVSADVTAGHAVLVPPPGNAKADTLAWWRVDPQTGQTLGIGPNGWGATAAEYAATLRHVFRFANMMFCLGGTISKGVGGAAGAQAALCILGAVGAGLGQAAGGPTGTVISMLGDAAATGRNVVGAASK
jgi:hypothetical protein